MTHLYLWLRMLSVYTDSSSNLDSLTEVAGGVPEAAVEKLVFIMG